MLSFARIADSIRATSKKLEKVAILGGYLKQLPLDQAAAAAVFFSGRPFPAFEEATLQVGAALLWRVSADVAQVSEGELSAHYRRFGDLGDALEAALGARLQADKIPPAEEASISLLELAAAFRELASARGPAAKAVVLQRILQRAAPGEAKYIVKIILGDLRIGLRESLVEEAIARAFEQPLAQVQRANMMLGDIGQTLGLAAKGKLAEAPMRLFHPLGFMLATAVESAEEAMQHFSAAHESAAIEDKYDGIRAQVHVGEREGRREVRIFSRTLDEVSGSFPELVSPLASLPGEFVLDGEIVAWQNGRALPFAILQQRLGRKKIAAAHQRAAPLAYVAFDVLYANRDLVIDRPLSERSVILNGIFAAPRLAPAEAATAPGQLSFFAESPTPPQAEVLRAPVAQADSAEDLDRLFDLARQRGNEGLMIKDLESPYTPGRRGGAWLKLKRELATLDVVVTAAEYGHGKRAGVLSDYTFAVRDRADADRLLNIGKAYSGLTDVEIAELTKFFLEHTITDEGFRRQVEPLIVLEVAFNSVMKSDRYESGFALRFPRIVRWRRDKLPADIDTLAALNSVFEREHSS